MIKKIKAGALQYVLVISVIIAIILFAFISLVFLQQKIQLKNDFSIQAIDNVQMGFDYLETKAIPYNEEQTLPLIRDENTTIKAQKSPWGIFDIVRVSSKVKNEYFEKTALVGGSQKNRETLYLKENNQSLVLVGKTQIRGDVSLPKQGVKSGNISGVSYYGREYVEGVIKISSNQLPILKNKEQLEAFSNLQFLEDYSSAELIEDMNIKHSFTKKTLFFRESSSIDLENIHLKGNIIIQSASKITVYPSASLNSVILIAPKVVLRSNVLGDFQVLASEKIEVEPNVKLSYPSALIVLNQNERNTQQRNTSNTNEQKEGIILKKDSEVKGIVYYQSKSAIGNYQTQIHIESKSTVIGEVYCDKNLSLEGKVIGSVYTNNFIIKKSGGTYVNHLYDAILDETSLPKQYSGLQLESDKNTVVQWLE